MKAIAKIIKKGKRLFKNDTKVEKCDVSDEEEEKGKEEIDIVKVGKKRKQSPMCEEIETEFRTIIKKRKKVFEESKNALDTGELICPICMDYLVHPSTAVCGHTFCERCFFEWMMFSRSCPVCRCSVRAQQPINALLINTIIERVLQSNKNNKNDLNRWIDRTENHKQWLKDKSALNIEAGGKIDACDTEHIWCEADVILVLTFPNMPSVYKIHYHGWAKMYDEFVPSNSHRLAPHRFFTQRRDIPRYLLSSEGNCRYGYVVTGNEDRIEEQDLNILVDREGPESNSNSNNNSNNNNNNNRDELNSTHSAPTTAPNGDMGAQEGGELLEARVVLPMPPLSNSPIPLQEAGRSNRRGGLFTSAAHIEALDVRADDSSGSTISILLQQHIPNHHQNISRENSN